MQDSDLREVQISHGRTRLTLHVLESDDHISNLIARDGEFYEKAVLDRISAFDFADAMAVDVGAFIGNHTVFFAQVLGLKTLAVEPNPVALKVLETNVAANGLSERVEVAGRPLWSHPVAGRMSDDDPANRGRARFLTAEEGPLRAETLDGLTAGREIALLKVDAEGAEVEILRGGLETLARSRPLVVVECQTLEERAAVDALLQPLGYLRIGRAGATPTYFYATPRQALNVALSPEFNAHPALYRLNPKTYQALAATGERAAWAQRVEALERALDAAETANAVLERRIEDAGEEAASLRASLRRQALLAERAELTLAESRFKIETLSDKVERLHEERRRLTEATGADASSLETAERYLRVVDRRVRAKRAELSAERAAPSPALLPADPAVHRSRKVVVSMASFPLRAALLERVVDRVAPQCDLLQVYLNEFEEVPAFLNRRGVRAVLGSEAAGDLKDNGKFYFVEDVEDGFQLFIDDDIFYPADYVETVLRGVEEFGFHAVVGFHGTIYEPPGASYIRDRVVLPFMEAARTTFVDQLGTGTVGFHSSTLRLKRSDFPVPGMADLWFAKRAAEAGAPLVALARENRWLTPMEEIGETLFRRAQRDDRTETDLLQNTLGPSLRAGPRVRAVAHLLSTRPADRLDPDRLDLEKSLSGAFGVPGRRRVKGDPHFAIIAVGWNCGEAVEACLASIANQAPGGYTMDVHVYDDGSTDDSWDRIQRLSAEFRISAFRGERNLGPGYARWFLLNRIVDPDAVCVLVDLDDELLPTALRTVAEIYRNDSDCWMTYGDWINQHGEANKEGFYSRRELAHRLYRSSDKFKFTHLRTFRRFLFDRITPENMQDQDGEWLRYCSDVGLMLPIADQCAPGNIRAVREPLYRYNQYRGAGTQRRFGGEVKEKLFRRIQSDRRLWRTQVPKRAAGAARAGTEPSSATVADVVGDEDQHRPGDG